MNKVVVSEEVVQSLPLFNIPLVESEIESNPQPLKPPRLTLKFLNERIMELQEENLMLITRMNEMDQILRSYAQIHVEAAATSDIFIDFEHEVDIFPNCHIPRSVRHSAPTKKSFWSILFRSSLELRTILKGR